MEGYKFETNSQRARHRKKTVMITVKRNGEAEVSRMKRLRGLREKAAR